MVRSAVDGLPARPTDARSGPPGRNIRLGWAHAQPTSVDERQSVRKRRAILAAAATVFLQKGYLGTSMDEVAALASVSKQTVYKHFSDKERLFAEIVDKAGIEKQ